MIKGIDSDNVLKFIKFHVVLYFMAGPQWFSGFFLSVHVFQQFPLQSP